MTELLIVFVVNDNVQLMDIAGPADVFAEANTLYGQPIYRSILVAPQKTIRSSCGFVMQADYCLEGINALSIDTLLVAGAPNAARSAPAQGVIQWLSHTASQARRLRPFFAAGAATASFLWFALLGYGTHFLQPFFASPRSWKILDLLIGCIMLALAALLLWQGVLHTL